LNFEQYAVVTAAQMREMDRLTIQKYGVPSLTLMERAGEGITKAILERFGRPAKKGVLVVAGKGNNGGDGFVVARLLKNKRIPCEVALLARKNELSPDAAHNLGSYTKLRGKITEIAEASGSAAASGCAARIARGRDSRNGIKSAVAVFTVKPLRS
jgi:NAD(P)H-hydrate epimerase